MEQTAHVVAVIAHAKLTPDEPADAVAGPDVGLVAVRQRPLRDQPNEPSLLRRRQLRRSPRRGAYLVDLLSNFVTPVSPTHHGARLTADPTRHLVQREPFIQELQCAATPRGQHRGRSLRSHDTTPPEMRVLHYLGRYQ